MKRTLALAASTSTLLALTLAGPAAASDHLANAIAATGSNPANPAASPGTVPGEGDPNSGQDQTTPAVDLCLVSTRSGGHGQPASADCQ
jgi:hypothetical protein